MESDLLLGGRMYRCKNIQYPNHDPKLGFLNLNSRNHHQSRCPFQQSSYQGILEPLNFQTIQNNCSHPPDPLLNQTQHSINLPRIPRLGLPVENEQLPSNPVVLHNRIILQQGTVSNINLMNDPHPFNSSRIQVGDNFFRFGVDMGDGIMEDANNPLTIILYVR